MSDPRNWAGFKPDTSPLPDPVMPKKSPQEQLDEVVAQIETLQERREELHYEVAKEEVREDQDFLEEIHKDCISQEHLDNEVEQARAEGDEDVEEAWGLVREFGGHGATCLSGALAGSQALHPLCTCGWNEVATRLERR